MPPQIPEGSRPQVHHTRTPETPQPAYPSQSHSRPGPSRFPGRGYLDKTSRSSSADSSRSRVLPMPAMTETPTSRSFSFSPLEEAAIAQSLTNRRMRSVSYWQEGRDRKAEGRVIEVGRVREELIERRLWTWRCTAALAPSAGRRRTCVERIRLASAGPRMRDSAQFPGSSVSLAAMERTNGF